MLDSLIIDDACASLTLQQARWLRTYISEAAFFDTVLADDLAALAPGTPVLEVGSGIGLLSMLMAARGLAVTSVEPASAGFGDNALFRQIVRCAWAGPEPDVRWFDGRVEELPLEPAYDYAVAINVLEHVPSPEALINETVARLHSRGIFRFVCPNYTFPYEPHFEMPTLFTKRLTGKVMARRISNAGLRDPQGLWDELSWPTARGLRSTLREAGWAFQMSDDATVAYLERATSDEAFAERKSAVVGAVGRLLASVPRGVIDAVPIDVLPVIDCRLCNYRQMR